MRKRAFASFCHGLVCFFDTYLFLYTFGCLSENLAEIAFFASRTKELRITFLLFVLFFYYLIIFCIKNQLLLLLCGITLTCESLISH